MTGQEFAEVVRSGVWLYGDLVTNEVWIVKQNFNWYYDVGFEDEPEQFNADGEVFQVVFARDSRVTTVSLSRLSLDAAVEYAEKLIPQGVKWTNHLQQRLFHGRRYSLTP